MAIFVKKTKPTASVKIPAEMAQTLSAPALAVILYICTTEYKQLNIDQILRRFDMGLYTWRKVSRELKERNILKTVNNGAGTNLEITI